MHSIMKKYRKRLEFVTGVGVREAPRHLPLALEEVTLQGDAKDKQMSSVGARGRKTCRLRWPWRGGGRRKAADAARLLARWREAEGGPRTGFCFSAKRRSGRLLGCSSLNSPQGGCSLRSGC